MGKHSDIRTGSVTDIKTDTPEHLPSSWEKLIEVLDYLNVVIEPHVQVRFAIKRLAPNLPSENAENVAIARKVGVTSSTIENWRSSAGTNCSMPLRLMVVIAKTFKGSEDGPERFLRAFENATGDDHSVHFSWMKRGPQ